MPRRRPGQTTLAIITALIALIFTSGATESQNTPTLEIWEIQGSRSASSYEGKVVTTIDAIVTAVGTRGFFIQTPSNRSDGDPLTSDGIWVFTSSRPEVKAGDRVSITGKIAESYGNTEFSDQGLDLRITGSGAAMPAPIILSASFPPTENQRPDALEAYEGMLVRVEGASASGPAKRYYAGEPREEQEVPVVLGHQRPFREAGIAYPATGEDAALPLFDNNPEIFEFGFGGWADTADFTALKDAVTTGMSLSGTGPLIYRFSRYQLWPLAGSFTLSDAGTSHLPRPVPAGEAGQLRVATQNAHNLFDLTDDRGVEDGFDTPTAAEYSIQLEKLARQVCDILRTPDIIALQEVENINTLDHPDPAEADLVGAIEDVCAFHYNAYLLEGNDGRGIDNAYLVSDTLSVTDVFQIGAEAIFRPTVGTGPENLFDRPPLVLEAVYDPAGIAFPITVIAVHNKSYADSDRPRYRELRYQQALFLADAIQYRQEENPVINLVVTGDFNAFQFSDGLAPSVEIIAGTLDPATKSEAVWWPDHDIVQPNLVIQTKDRLPEEERYSYIYDGSAQALDHLLTSVALDAYVVGISYSRGNADAPYHYDDDATTALACSDHDGAVLVIDPAGYTPSTPADRDEVPVESTETPAGLLGQIFLGLVVAALAALLIALKRKKKK